jgi:hypothetical protein
VFAIATPIIYVICEMANWPLFTYHPEPDRIDLGWAPAVKDEGPAMYWYGWIATTLLGAGVLGLIAAKLPESATRRIPLALVWIVPLAACRSDLRAEVLLALVAEAHESLIACAHRSRASCVRRGLARRRRLRRANDEEARGRSISASCATTAARRSPTRASCCSRRAASRWC